MSAVSVAVSCDFEVEALQWDARGLIPVVVQGISSGAVLMVAWADREAVGEPIRSGRAHFWSRSREQLWRKGETSGNELVVSEIFADCDRDTLLYRAHPMGPTCHRGRRSCFEHPAELELGWLARVVRQRRSTGGPESYTRRLLDGGVERVAQKVGEEAIEVVIAAASGADAKEANAALVAEVSDLLYHLVVLLEATGVEPLEIAEELARRHRLGAAVGVEGEGQHEH